MTRRAWLIAGGVALVVVLGAGAAGLWQSSQTPASAEDATSAYLRALESGDSATVEATGIAVTPTALTAFDDASDLIVDTTVTEVEQSADAATAAVSFTLDDERYEAKISLSLIDGMWTVDSSGLGVVQASTSPGTALALGAASFAASEDITLLPAIYAAVTAPADLLDGRGDLVVLPGEVTEITLDATLRPEATATAQRVLDDHLEACTASGEIVPEGCGIRIPWGTEFRDVSDVTYRIEKLPSITLAESDFTAAGGVLVATVSGTGQDGAAHTMTYRTDDWSVRGDVTFTDRELVLETW